jgi:hypothetical protein
MFTTNTNTPVPMEYVPIVTNVPRSFWYWCISISSKHYVPGNDLGTLVTIGTYSIGTGVLVDHYQVCNVYY